MEKKFKITFWTQPTKWCSGRVEERVIKARKKSEAIYDAEDMYPNWAVVKVEEIIEG